MCFSVLIHYLFVQPYSSYLCTIYKCLQSPCSFIRSRSIPLIRSWAQDDREVAKDCNSVYRNNCASVRPKMSTPISLQMELLKGRENYDTWKFATQLYLEDLELWKCVTGEETDDAKNRKCRVKLLLLVDKINYIHVQETTKPLVHIQVNKMEKQKGSSEV